MSFCILLSVPRIGGGLCKVPPETLIYTEARESLQHTQKSELCDCPGPQTAEARSSESWDSSAASQGAQHSPPGSERIAEGGGSMSFFQETVFLDRAFPISVSKLEIQGS